VGINAIKDVTSALLSQGHQFKMSLKYQFLVIRKAQYDLTLYKGGSIFDEKICLNDNTPGLCIFLCKIPKTKTGEKKF
jgi:hypothetical protein